MGGKTTRGGGLNMKIVGGAWSNWSGGVTCKPRHVVTPKDEVELAAAVRTAESVVRVPGTGHSFTPLNATDGTLIDLAAFTGLKGMDVAREIATFGAATPLWEIGTLLHPLGFGLVNMGDIDRQTLGGVVGTATHGTGPTLGSFSASVTGFQILLASGEVLHCSRDDHPEIFDAGRVSMGMLGVMTEISLHVRPQYKLEEKGFFLPPEELFAKLDTLKAQNRHFEFFWFPYADRAICKTLNETLQDAPPPRSAEVMFARGEAGARSPDMLLFTAINEVLPYAPFLLRPAHRMFSQFMPAPPRVRWSHEAFPSPRNVRFNEMEYAVPAERGADCVREIVEFIRKNKINTGFPLEFRTVAADDAWLSPFYNRPSVTIALHQYRRVDIDKLFKPVEDIFRRYEGRPHWGKRHTRTAGELAQIYPAYERFRQLRAKLDPQGKFLNRYLKSLFG
jgi:FAD-linked oxidoreductase